MRVPVLATAIGLLALAGCEQSYSSSQTVTEPNGDVVERTVEFEVGGPRDSSKTDKSGAASGSPDVAGEIATPAPADAPVAPAG